MSDKVRVRMIFEMKFGYDLEVEMTPDEWAKLKKTSEAEMEGWNSPLLDLDIDYLSADVEVNCIDAIEVLSDVLEVIDEWKGGA